MHYLAWSMLIPFKSYILESSEIDKIIHRPARKRHLFVDRKKNPLAQLKTSQIKGDLKIYMIWLWNIHILPLYTTLESQVFDLE